MRPLAAWLLLVLLLGPASAAGEPYGDAKLSVHVTNFPAKSSTVCEHPPDDIPCRERRTATSLQRAYALYVVAASEEVPGGFSAVTFGVQYDPRGVYLNWYLCGDSESPETNPWQTWPDPGAGNRISWDTDNCQTGTIPGFPGEGAVAVPGAFYVYAYSPSRFSLSAGYPVGAPPQLSATSCTGETYSLRPGHAGYAEISTNGDTPGCNPCTGPCWENDPLACSVEPTEINFGTVIATEATTRPLAIRNRGYNWLRGAIGEPCEGFTIGRETGDYWLGPGSTLVTELRFQPPRAGSYTCVIDVGPRCSKLLCTGEALRRCSLTPSGFDFGVVTPGESAETVFTLVNTASTTMTGTIRVEAPYFEVVDPVYSLGKNQKHEFIVRYSPRLPGRHRATLYPGNDCPPQVTLRGTGGPSCAFDPPTVDFGPVAVGDTAEATVVITNIASIPVIGWIELENPAAPGCSAFSILSGQGIFDLAPGAQRTVVLEFSASSLGHRSCTLVTGLVCNAIPLLGNGVDPCIVAPTSLDFGTVFIGESESIVFEITNLGSSLTGEVALNSPEFSILSGGGAFTLDRGDTLAVEVAFTPSETGQAECTIDLGTSCPPVRCVGKGLFHNVSGSQEGSCLALHVVPHRPGAGCLSESLGGPAPDLTPCSRYVTTVPAPGAYDVYVVAARGDPAPGIAGASFGIQFDTGPGAGLHVLDWKLCANLDLPSAGWPQAGGGNTVIFDPLWNCQRDLVPGHESEGAHVVLGALYVYAYGLDSLSITPRSSAPGSRAEVLDCAAEPWSLPASHLARAVFGGSGYAGYNPCTNPTSVRLLAFEARREGAAARITWRVAAGPEDLLGFHVLRDDPGGGETRLTATPLQDGPEYEFRDADPPRGAARYWLDELTRDGLVIRHGPARLSPAGTGLPPLALEQNRPNPFAGGTVIPFRLEVPGNVRLRVFDLAGREVARPYDAFTEAGAHEVPWTGTTAAGSILRPGIYLYRLETPAGSVSKKLTILR